MVQYLSRCRRSRAMRGRPSSRSPRRSRGPAGGFWTGRTTTAPGAQSLKATRSWRAKRSSCWPTWAASIRQSPAARRPILSASNCPAAAGRSSPAAEFDISASVKAYFALKLTGHDPAADFMVRAREAIRAHGGADAVNSFTRFYLALLGQISYEHCPAVPPELVLLPTWFPVNIYAMSAWSRTIVVPLSIVAALEPVRPIEEERGIHELFLREPEHWPPLRCPGLPGGTGWLSWDHFFRVINRLLKFGQRKGWMPWRKKAVQAARQWILDRFHKSDGLGAIFPPVIFSVVALKALGYDDDSPEVQECMKQLRRLSLDDAREGTTRMQPCFSPVWDTGLTMRALALAGVPADDPAIVRAAEWLRGRQTTDPGDWSKPSMPRPAAGTLSMPTSSIPTLTTRPCR